MKLRENYGRQYANKIITSFWRWIIFTDEAYIDPTSLRKGNILREEGTREDPENIQQLLEKKGVKLHIAAWCSWDAKADKLEFYYDEEEYT